MFNGKMFTIVWLTVVGVSVVLIVSCDETERHEVLSFFFDGVPPLKEKGINNEEVMDGNLEALTTGERSEVARRSHGPGRDCKLCHKPKEKGRWAIPEVIDKTPELCYGCHSDYTKSGLFVHGPVAIGKCGFCHNPHDSSYDFLLRKPEPELCYRCHNQKSIESIPAHAELDLSSGCGSCHEVHSSSRKKLLKS